MCVVLFVWLTTNRNRDEKTAPPIFEGKKRLFFIDKKGDSIENNKIKRRDSK